MVNIYPDLSSIWEMNMSNIIINSWGVKIGYDCPLRINMDKIVKKVNNNKKVSMQSNQNNQISIKVYCIERGKTPKQSGQRKR